MPCPVATEMARTLERLHSAQKRAAKAAKTPSDKREADRLLILAHRAFNAARAAYLDAQKRNPAREAAE